MKLRKAYRNRLLTACTTSNKETILNSDYKKSIFAGPAFGPALRIEEGTLFAFPREVLVHYFHVVRLRTFCGVFVLIQDKVFNTRQDAKGKGNHYTNFKPFGGLENFLPLIVVVLVLLCCNALCQLLQVSFSCNSRIFGNGGYHNITTCSRPTTGTGCLHCEYTSSRETLKNQKGEETEEKTV
jgi:hypothetical protein